MQAMQDTLNALLVSHKQANCSLRNPTLNKKLMRKFFKSPLMVMSFLMICGAAESSAQAATTELSSANDFYTVNPVGTTTAIQDGNPSSNKTQDDYLATYRKWESKAKKTYDYGVKHKAEYAEKRSRTTRKLIKNGRRVLKIYQQDMCDTRIMAKGKGCDIPTSTYENVRF